jgi:hypothetical protein
VTALTFAQPARRNLLAPVLIAFLVLGIVIALLVRFTPHRVANVTVMEMSAFPAHTVFKTDSHLINRDREQDDLYVPVKIKIEDELHLPIFIKTFSATIATADGEQVQGTAAQKGDLEALSTTFPALRPMISSPLNRETLIDPDGSAEGMILLHFPVSADTWNKRRSATLSIELYHQGPLTVALPQGAPATPPVAN